jgi:hypothetical protein
MSNNTVLPDTSNLSTQLSMISQRLDALKPLAGQNCPLLNVIIAEVEAEIADLINSQTDQLSIILPLIEIPTDISSVIEWITALINTYVGPYAKYMANLVVIANQVVIITAKIEYIITYLHCDFSLSLDLTDLAISAYINGDISMLDASMLSSLTSTQIGSLTSAQIAGKVINGISISPGLSLSQLQLLTPTQISYFQAAQLAMMLPTQIKALTTDQLIAIPPTTMSGDTSATPPIGLQVSYLTDDQISALTSDQLNALTSVQLNSFSSDQVKMISIISVTNLTYGTISIIITELSDAQVANINSSLFTSITITQLQSLSSDQLASVNPQLLLGFSVYELTTLTYIDALTTLQRSVFTSEQLLILFPTPQG